MRSLIIARVGEVGRSAAWKGGIEQLFPGKMLRTRLAARLFVGEASTIRRPALQAACAATEMVHTASLCHDDVVDNAVMRRALPALWRVSGPSAAILIGDLVLCEAMRLLLETDGGRYLGEFVAKVQEVVAAEAEQELLWRGRQPDESTCLRLARGKTGPLFAFVAQVCGYDDPELGGALDEAGYRIGTAYQLADDLLDVIGNEHAAGKTLGTDRKRSKSTLPQAGTQGSRRTSETIGRLCDSAVEILHPHPEAQRGLADFLASDLQPIFCRQDKQPAASEGLMA
ncbi:MAG: polyprenyl synthetase family protein [Planctomycetota bacterium]